MTFGDKIKQIRTGMGLTQVKFAELCEIAEPTCCKMEQGRHFPRLDTMFIISKKLNMTVSELLEGVTEEWR